MKIDYSRFPILQSLEQERFNSKVKILTFEEDVRLFGPVLFTIFSNWSKLSLYFKKNIVYLSQEYFECMNRSWHSFNQINLIDAISPSSGCLIYKQKNGHYFAMCYIIKSMYDISLTLLYDCDTIICEINGSYEEPSYIVTSDTGLKEGCKDDESFAISTLNILICYLLMEKYAKVETCICGKKSKINRQKRKNEKVLNSTNLDVVLKDSTWFTNICRNENFKVRGHFRLQPKKDKKGEWVKELIYINEFEKQGYHRKAKILKTFTKE